MEAKFSEAQGRRSVNDYILETIQVKLELEDEVGQEVLFLS